MIPGSRRGLLLQLWHYGWIVWPLATYALSRLGVARSAIRFLGWAILIAGFAHGASGDIVLMAVAYLGLGEIGANLDRRRRPGAQVAAPPPRAPLVAPPVRAAPPPDTRAIALSMTAPRERPPVARGAIARDAIAQALAGRRPTVSPRRRGWFF